MINLKHLMLETRGTVAAIDERDIALIAGSADVGSVQSEHKVLRARQKEIQRQIRDKARLSDVFADDVRFLCGQEKIIEEVLTLKDAALVLQKSASK